MITLVEKERKCPYCNKQTKQRKQITMLSFILIILSVCSFGVVAPIWLIYEFYLSIFKDIYTAEIMYAYRCSECKGLIAASFFAPH